MGKSTEIDWITVFLFIILVGFGWMNIYSASLNEASTFFFDMSQTYGRQALFIGLSLILIVFILSVEAKFYERFSSVIYLVALLSLLGLFVFGRTISGSTSWYTFGSFSIQPTEFAKIAAALALAKYLSDIQTNIKTFKHQITAFGILFLPVLLIMLQPDPGSAIVYAAFFFPLYREGISAGYLLVFLSFGALFVFTLLFGSIWVSIGVILMALLVLFINRKKNGNTIYDTF